MRLRNLVLMLAALTVVVIAGRLLLLGPILR